MEATLSHMQTHGQIKGFGAKGECILNSKQSRWLYVCLNEARLWQA